MWRHAYEEAGGMNVNQFAVLDYDLWMRMVKLYPMVKINEHLATSRMYRENKTISKRGIVYREILSAVKTHFGYVPFDWAFGYACYLADRKDQFFEKTEASRGKYLLSLAVGLYYNQRQWWRYLNEWTAASGIQARFPSRWVGGWMPKR